MQKVSASGVSGGRNFLRKAEEITAARTRLIKLHKYERRAYDIEISADISSKNARRDIPAPVILRRARPAFQTGAQRVKKPAFRKISYKNKVFVRFLQKAAGFGQRPVLKSFNKCRKGGKTFAKGFPSEGQKTYFQKNIIQKQSFRPPFAKGGRVWDSVPRS